MEITFTNFFLADSSLFLTLAFTLLFCFLAFRFFFPILAHSSNHHQKTTTCGCFCSSCNNTINEVEEEDTSVPYYSNGGGRQGTQVRMRDRGASASVMTDKQSGASMMEQLVPEITTHALSYLDYPSLCRLSMTNSLMRKAANDDNAWKALYHKDFTLEQNGVTPVNGWKAYYATTRAIVNINADFFNIIRERSLPGMNQLWLNADYVKCIHASGEIFSGYNAVMQSWQLAFEWQQAVDFQIRDVCARVLTDTAWVTMKAYVDMETGPFNVTNVFEFHNEQWYLVHHHSSVMLIVGGVEQQMVHG